MIIQLSFSQLAVLAVVVVFVVAGLFFSWKSRFYQITGLPFILKNTVGTLLKRDDYNKKKGISPFQAVTTALAGTMGVGNISGVATAIVGGGPGAIFWMWVGAFLGMMTKYAEIFLAVKHRRKSPDGRYYGGPMYYMEDRGMRGTACVFALLCAVCSLGIGNMTQANSVSTAVQQVFQIPTWCSGIAIALIVGLIMFGGIRRIAKFTEMVIPFISILYLFFAGACLYIHRSQIPGVFRQILEEAFRLRSTVAGLAGYGVRQALTFGLSRGVFTNEAGLGSAPIAHAAADCKDPSRQAVWGIMEVFLDTILICTITALVILLAGGGTLWNSGLDGAPLTSAAFADAFGALGSRFIAISLVFFAVPAMLGWSYYGEAALRYVSPGGSKVILLYRAVFLLCICLGSTMELTKVWAMSDILNVMMAIPNIIALFLLHKEIVYPKR